MRKDFIEKIKKEHIIDTKKYRYVFEGTWDYAYIKRLPIKYLDTTRAINDWETIYKF